ncbi:hypothetical protein ACFQZU_04295 [Streptomonospora algeriensis]|uniref:Uncharacterized protein n=1 Tax=Streptomonospora algeriensis TaxID=995084 RepID=A0ABW3BBS8_9ACTN
MAPDTVPNRLAIIRWYSWSGLTLPDSQRFHELINMSSSGSWRVVSYLSRRTHSRCVQPRRSRSRRMRRAQLGGVVMVPTFLMDPLMRLGGS